jgi:hypothetical protein
MPFSPNARNQMLDAELATVYVSLHSADPTATHTSALANEISGGSPAYARKLVALSSAASGSKSQTATPIVFDIGAGKTLTHVAYWKVASAGAATDYLGSAALSTPETFGSQGTYTITAQVFTIS